MRPGSLELSVPTREAGMPFDLYIGGPYTTKCFAQQRIYH